MDAKWRGSLSATFFSLPSNSIHPFMNSNAKGYTVPVLAALSATGPLGIDMYLPAIPDMAIALNTNEGAVQLTLMTFFVGLMLGQLMYGPLSDKFGRKPLITLGLGIFLIGSIGCALAQTITQLQWLRFLQGFGGSIGMVIAFAIIKDSYTGAAVSKMMSLIIAVVGVTPVLAPIAGDFLQTVGSWHTIFWFMAIYAVLLALAASFLLPESRTPAAREGVMLSRTLHNYGRILIDKRFIPFTLASCFAQGAFFAYLGGSASVFISEYGLSPTQFSLLFGFNALGVIGAAIATPRLHRRLGPLNTDKATSAAFFVVLGLLTLYLAADGASFLVLSIGLFVAIALMGFIMPTGSQLALLQQGKYAGTASALLGSMQFAAGAIVTAISGALVYLGSVGLVTIMLVCAAASTLICVLLFPRTIELVR